MPIDITVNTNGVSQDPSVTKGTVATIQWTCGTGVASFAISGLAKPPFSQAGTAGGRQVTVLPRSTRTTTIPAITSIIRTR